MFPERQERRSLELCNFLELERNGNWNLLFLELERNDWNFLKSEELFVLERLNAGNFDHRKLASAFKFL